MNRRKKRQEDEIMTEYFLDALENKQVPLLTLDARWHELFPDFRKTGEIKALEKKLNKLLQKQGQTNNDLKEYEKAKKVLMKNIVNNMTDGHEVDSPIRSMKQDRNQKLLADLKEKKEKAEQVQREIPQEIEEANKELLVACMKVCYRELMDNTYEIEEIDEWVKETREKLKEEILKKQDMEMRNTQMYKYMHNLLGAEVVEIFDSKHQVWKGNLEENQFDE
ncbi:MAG: hypothetical protein MR965_08590 [Lachnospiraceae bacterium]|nr:hypothetical protein [Lachnospiraceae bacterium]